MREVAFINQNKSKWLEFEKYLFLNEPMDAEQLAEVFTQINSDLAYAQTFYPKSKLIIYLNALAANAYYKLHQPQSSFYRLIDFWRIDVPLVVYKNRKYIYFSFLFFALFVVIGVFSAMNDETFIRMILGDSYVESTYENIQKGDPAAIYNNDSMLGDAGSFLGITINNIRVGLLMYISGFTFGIGTLNLLMQNSVMLGAFQTMFFQAGQLAASMSAIWIHGAMEIFGMVIEASAGLLLGLGWLLSGTLTRRQAFIMSGKESLMIVLSTIPFTISAGLLEGFVTQYYNEMPIALTLLIILGTLALIAYYYLIYPILLAKRRQASLDKTFLQYAAE